MEIWWSIGRYAAVSNRQTGIPSFLALSAKFDQRSELVVVVFDLCYEALQDHYLSANLVDLEFRGLDLLSQFLFSLLVDPGLAFDLVGEHVPFAGLCLNDPLLDAAVLGDGVHIHRVQRS